MTKQLTNGIYLSLSNTDSNYGYSNYGANQYGPARKTRTLSSRGYLGFMLETLDEFRNSLSNEARGDIGKYSCSATECDHEFIKANNDHFFLFHFLAETAEPTSSPMALDKEAETVPEQVPEEETPVQLPESAEEVEETEEPINYGGAYGSYG
jgi:hypothetical protein